jgi:solute carrier family 25 S-adenosylmethionine transporter 26
VKQKFQMGYVTSFRHAVGGLVTREAIPLFIASARATAMRDILHTGLQMSLYESFKHAAATQTGSGVDHLPAGQAALCGSMAGSISAILTTPVDVLRTQVNLRSADIEARRSRAGHTANWKQLFTEEARATYRAKGVKGFFAGAGLRAASMGMGGFLFLGTFELAKSHLSGDS